MTDQNSDHGLLLDLYAMMKRIRLFEERVASCYRAGEIPGFIHLYLGEEAVATGVCAVLQDEDIVTSTHRGHGHAIAKGCRTDRIMAELFARTDGYSGGRGGSMHVYALQHGLLGTNGIVGGGIPLAVGAGLTFKTLGKLNVAVTFFSDGASNGGGFYESLNHAAVYRLPVVFVCENNLYATSTPLASVANNPEIATRAQAFNMPGIAVDGNDVCAVYQAAKQAVDLARSGGGPTLIEAKTYRICGHHEGDQLYGTYRTRAELEEWTRRCPITKLRDALVGDYGVSEEVIEGIDHDVRAEIDAAAEFARLSPHPDPEDIEDHVFAEVI